VEDAQDQAVLNNASGKQMKVEGEVTLSTSFAGCDKVPINALVSSSLPDDILLTW